MTGFSKLKLFGGALALLAMICAPLAAQSKNMTKQEQANLKMVMDWWRIGLVAAHPEAAEKYLAENLIQHNPNFPQGRAAVKAMLSRRPPVNSIHRAPRSMAHISTLQDRDPLCAAPRCRRCHRRRSLHSLRATSETHVPLCGDPPCRVGSYHRRHDAYFDHMAMPEMREAVCNDVT